MFLINIRPWSAHKSMEEYACFLLKQHILPHYRNGSSEVHLLFDDPECQRQSPKFFERQSRDSINPVSDDHFCVEFFPDMMVPPKWREDIISCRKCKRNLVCFLSFFFLENIQRKLQPHQRFVTGGGFNGALSNKAMFVSFNTKPEFDAILQSNAEEADTRIWLHVKSSAGRRKLVLSPDTDVYHIGLPIIAQTDLEVIVRLSSFSSLEHRLLDMQGLIKALINDPDLGTIQPSLLPSVIQMLYVCTGCDFISFFSGYGKASFMATLCEYCEFICSNSVYSPGTLSNLDPESNGYLSFFRLVGCTYFKKHKTVFLPSLPTPMTLFNSLAMDNQSAHNHHKAWLDVLRERIWSRITYEEEMIPSDEALLRHWKRSCWVVTVWRQAACNQINYPPLDGNGWKNPTPSTLEVDWDSEENISNVRKRVALVKKGCG